jgi:hypothetical protein
MKLQIMSDLHLAFGEPAIPNTDDYTIKGARVVCNPRGYMRNGSDQNSAFDAGLVIDV